MLILANFRMEDPKNNNDQVLIFISLNAEYSQLEARKLRKMTAAVAIMHSDAPPAATVSVL